jgi:hypothetical protein
MTNKVLPIYKIIFPSIIDNSFYGGRIPLYVFCIITIITLWRSQHHLFSSDGGAQSIATIPLHTFSESAQLAVIGVFSLWGLSQLIIALVYLIASIRYKSLIPLLYVLMIVEYFIRAFYIGNFKPIPLEGTAPGGLLNVPVIIIAMVMLSLIFYNSHKSLHQKISKEMSGR